MTWSRISMKSCWHLFDLFFRCTKSNTIFGGLIDQGGKMKYEGVSKMSEKSMLEAVKTLLDTKAKSRCGTWPRIKQLHMCIIKHRITCTIVWQRLYLGSIQQR